jgi:translation initiation factor IF-1
MRAQDAFQVEGVVTEVCSERTCRVRLANGHVVFGFVPVRQSGQARLLVGRTVNLQLSPYDLSEGRIIVEAQSN